MSARELTDEMLARLQESDRGFMAPACAAIEAWRAEGQDAMAEAVEAEAKRWRAWLAARVPIDHASELAATRARLT